MVTYPGITASASEVGPTGPGAMPAFGTAGALSESAALAGNKTIVYPAAVAVEDLLLCIAYGTNEIAPDAAVAMHASMVAAGFAHVAGSPYTDLVTPIRHSLLVAWKIAAGTEGGGNIPGSVTGSGGTTNDCFLGVCVKFTAADGFAATPYESVTTATLASGTTQAMATVTPTDINRLAVNIFACANDVMNFQSATGETGGNWTEVLDIESALGGQATIQVQTSSQAGGGAVSGGTAASNTTGSAVRFAFALIPATV